MPAQGHVLIIDDEPRICGLLVRILSRDFDVVAVDDGFDALALIEHGARFDVVVCDIHMRRISGPSFRDLSQRLAPEQAQRIVFLTGNSDSIECDRVRDHEILTKPFNPRALVDLVSRVATASRDGYFPSARPDRERRRSVP